MAEVSIDELLPLVNELMKAMGRNDRLTASAACLLTYFMLSGPRPFNKRELADLLAMGSSLLMPLIVQTILEAPDHVPLNIPHKES
jgi:hypothetical protein